MEAFITEIKSYKKWLFLMIFLTGAACITLLKFFFNIDQKVVTLIPICLMTGYFFFLPRTDDSLENTNQYGDSLYYLGFLFTLVSLACSLVKFNINNQGVDVIISNLGIALATTITGMVLRIVYLQLLDVGFTDEDIRYEFNKTTLHLKEELGNALVDINLLREQTKVVLDDFKKDIEETHKKNIDSTNKVYKVHEETISSFSKYYKKELTTLIDDVKYFCDVSTQEAKENNQKSMETYNENLKKSLDKFDKTTGGIVDKIKDFEKSQEKYATQFNKTLAEVFESLTNFTANIKNVESTPEKMVKKLDDNLVNFQNTIQKVNEEFTSNLEVQQKIHDNLHSISEKTSILVSEFDSISGALKAINLSTEKIESNKITDAIKEYQKTIASFKVDSTAFTASFNKSVEQINAFNQKLDDVRITPDRFEKNITESCTKIEEVISTMSKIAAKTLAINESNHESLKDVTNKSKDLSEQYDNFKNIMILNSQDLKTFNRKINEVSSNLNSKDIASNFQDYEKSVELMKDRSKLYLNFFATFKDSVEEFNNSIEREMLKSKDYVNDVHKSLLNMTDLIISNIKPS